MKYSALVHMTPRRHAARGPTGPTLSFNEAIEEFGATKGVLMQALQESGAPKFRLHTGRKKYYDARELRAWWKARQKT